MSLVLIVIGCIIMVIGWVWLMINAFTDNAMWGIGIFFCGILGLAYGATKWDELKVPTLMYAGGLVLTIIGQVI